jgi:heme/copper-type cytochrome/quinol oxidase subunit 1
MFNSSITRLLSFISTTDHKVIGRLYIIFGGFSALIGSMLSFLIRLCLSGGHTPMTEISLTVITSSNIILNTLFILIFDKNFYFIIDPMLYNTIITMHGIVMIFMFVMPVLIGGFGNLLLPLQVGSPEMAFPRMNNISF